MPAATLALTLRDRALQSRDVIELLANKWRIAVLHILREHPLRTSEIQAALPEISPKVLTQTLRGMERDGLIYRHVREVVPAHVEYELSPMGLSLLQPLRELCLWAKAHLPERNRARAEFDRNEKRGRLRGPKSTRESAG
jgi:DNA-binding HxlR family transcriptional regulator